MLWLQLAATDACLHACCMQVICVKDSAKGVLANASPHAAPGRGGAKAHVRRIHRPHRVAGAHTPSTLMSVCGCLCTRSLMHTMV